MKKLMVLALAAIFTLGVSAQCPQKKECKKQCPKTECPQKPCKKQKDCKDCKDCKKECKKSDCKKQCPKK